MTFNGIKSIWKYSKWRIHTKYAVTFFPFDWILLKLTLLTPGQRDYTYRVMDPLNKWCHRGLLPYCPNLMMVFPAKLLLVGGIMVQPFALYHIFSGKRHVNTTFNTERLEVPFRQKKSSRPSTYFDIMHDWNWQNDIKPSQWEIKEKKG